MPMSEPADERTRLYRAAEARRPADARGGLVASQPARALTLSYPVKGFPWVRSDDGEEFEADTLELTYEWWDGWMLLEVELGGSDPRFKPSRYVYLTVKDLAAPELPEWAAGFVADLDVARVLAS